MPATLHGVGFTGLYYESSDIKQTEGESRGFPLQRGSSLPTVLPYQTHLAMWIDCSVTASITKSGTNVTAIADQTANGRNLTVGATPATYKPAYQNGHDVVEFPTGANATNATNWASIGAPVTFICVFNQHYVGGTGRGLQSPITNWVHGYYNQHYPGFFYGSSIVGGYGNTDANFHIFSGWISASSSSCYYDSQSAITGAGTTLPNGLSINTGPYAEAGDNFVAEILVYTEQMSDANRANVELYLRTKWGTP